MEEEPKVEEPEIKEEPKAEEPEVEEPSADEDPVETLAREMGWNPNHDGRDGRPTLSAKDFIRKSREIQDTASKHIKKQSREISELKNGLENLKQHNEAVYKAHLAQLRRELVELKKQRKIANDESDFDSVREIDEQIDEINKIPEKLPTAGATIDPRYLEWVEENEWYETDQELKVYADMLGNQPEYRALAQRNYPEALKKIEGVVKKMFPDRFGLHTQHQEQSKKVQPPAVESATRRVTNQKKKWTMNDLTRDQQDLAVFYEKQGIMKKEQYIEELQLRAEQNI